ncbi:hypothetical protein XI09_09155 [Bradyrhizobium sp. CCBAU 11386]|nr:hypothetical protein [Bradyrhizobium sp. CCBAU 11386]
MSGDTFFSSDALADPLAVKDQVRGLFLAIFPDSVAGALACGDILQVLLFASCSAFHSMALGKRGERLRGTIDNVAPVAHLVAAHGMSERRASFRVYGGHSDLRLQKCAILGTSAGLTADSVPASVMKPAPVSGGSDGSWRGAISIAQRQIPPRVASALTITDSESIVPPR